MTGCSPSLSTPSLSRRDSLRGTAGEEATCRLSSCPRQRRLLEERLAAAKRRAGRRQLVGRAARFETDLVHSTFGTWACLTEVVRAARHEAEAAQTLSSLAQQRRVAEECRDAAAECRPGLTCNFDKDRVAFTFRTWACLREVSHASRHEAEATRRLCSLTRQRRLFKELRLTTQHAWQRIPNLLGAWLQWASARRRRRGLLSEGRRRGDSRLAAWALAAWTGRADAALPLALGGGLTPVLNNFEPHSVDHSPAIPAAHSATLNANVTSQYCMGQGNCNLLHSHDEVSRTLASSTVPTQSRTIMASWESSSQTDLERPTSSFVEVAILTESVCQPIGFVCSHCGKPLRPSVSVRGRSPPYAPMTECRGDEIVNSTAKELVPIFGSLTEKEEDHEMM